jgi:hypothetical protein
MRTLVVIAMALALAACKKEETDPNSATAKIIDDNQILAEANAAAGDVVRAAGDCDAVKAALPAARQKLDELQGKVRTATGRTTLGAIRKRVEDSAQLCP